MIEKKLDKLCDKFFPHSGAWYDVCLKKPNPLSDNYYNDDYFPCHTRDIYWLSVKFEKRFHLFFISIDRIRKYMETSEKFKQARHDYEQKIVKWQINFMSNCEERWCTSEKCGDLSQLSPDWDKAFRYGIVDTLLTIDMPIDAIEEGIEKNADKWRSIKMESSFRNAYNPIFNYLEPIEARLEAPDPKFHDAWMKMRLYEYYQEHKESVDKYGEVLDEMKMTDAEAQELQQYLEIKIQERLNEIKIADEKKLTRKK